MKRILTDREINVAKKLKADGYTYQAIADMMGVNVYPVMNMVNDSFREKKLAYNKGYYTAKKRFANA